MTQRPQFLAIVENETLKYECSGIIDGSPALASAVSDDSTIVLLQGRLHYASGTAGQNPADESDVRKVLSAYRRRGAAALSELEGEYSLAIWDKQEHRLIIQRDPFGSWPLYWHADGARVIVGTDLHAISRKLSGRNINVEFLAEFLMQPCPTVEIASPATAFEGICRVLPGTSVEFHKGRQTRTVRYWNWSDRIQPIAETTLESAAARFGELLQNAVNERCQQGTIAAHVSGGMDSTSVACLARNFAERSGQRLITLSQIYDFPSLVTEREYIKLFLDQGGPITPVSLLGSQAVNFSWFDRSIPLHDEPYCGLRGIAALQMLNNAAAESGAQTVLTGLGSDEVLDSMPFHLGDLLRRGRLLAAFLEAGRWAQALNVNMWTILSRFGFESLMPIMAREGIHPRLHGGVGAWPNLGSYTIPSWIQDGFARSQQLRQRGLQHCHRINASPSARTFELNILTSTVGDWGRWYLAAPRGMNVSHPFRDPRLVCYALGIPLHLRAIAGRTKPILQEAMKGILPERIRIRHGKRGFDDVYGLGLRRNLSRLEKMIRRSRISELRIFNTEELIRILHSAASGLGDVLARERIDKSLALIFWFDQLESQPPSISCSNSLLPETASSCWYRGKKVTA